MLLFIVTMLSAWSCDSTQAEKARAALDEKIEKQLDYADSTGTGNEVRQKIADVLEGNSKTSFEAEKKKLTDISGELTSEELHAVLTLAQDKKQARLDKEIKEKLERNEELATAQNKVTTLARGDPDKDKDLK